jgi:copper chaperone
METVTIKVGGMSCQGCVGSVDRVLRALDGVAQVSVSLEPAQATVVYEPQRVGLGAIKAAIEGAGFDAN